MSTEGPKVHSIPITDGAVLKKDAPCWQRAAARPDGRVGCLQKIMRTPWCRMPDKLTRCQHCQFVQIEANDWLYVLYEPSGRWLWVCGTCNEQAAQRLLPRKTPNQL